MACFFTSDTHFGHANILQYSNRPFASIEEHDAELIRRWNARVRPGDVVYHLGDFALVPRARLAGYRRQLNGTIVLIRGNHDGSRTALLEAGFETVSFDRGHFDILAVPGGPELIRLQHRPPRDEAWRASGAVAVFHGHVHTAWARQGDLFNVGVDVRGYAPVTVQELVGG